MTSSKENLSTATSPHTGDGLVGPPPPSTSATPEHHFNHSQNSRTTPVTNTYFHYSLQNFPGLCPPRPPLFVLLLPIPRGPPPLGGPLKPGPPSPAAIAAGGGGTGTTPGGGGRTRLAIVEAKIFACRGSNAPGSIMPLRKTSRRMGSPALMGGAFRSTATRT